MKIYFSRIFFSVLFLIFIQCKNKEENISSKPLEIGNSIAYAKNISIYKHLGYSIVKVTNPWPKSVVDFTYILQEKNGIVPDSLKRYTTIAVPLQSIVVTSTTNIPFLEILGVEKLLLGFPHTDYVSSDKTRALINKGLVKNIGENEKLNTEQLIDLNPNLIVTFGVENSNPTIANLEKSGLKVLIQADWMEQTPLGKAEWIKLYGALFGKEKEAQNQFNTIVKNYNKALKMLADRKPSSKVMYGSMYQNQWFVACGNSWVAQFIKDAKAQYIWADIAGTGSIALPFEKVLEQAQTAHFWIASTASKTLLEFKKSNPHYAEFAAFKSKNVYTFDSKTGATGGVVFYELAPSRPDLVLQDYIKIFHPNLLPHYKFTFVEKLN